MVRHFNKAQLEVSNNRINFCLR